jgi:hypothetical protein
MMSREARVLGKCSHDYLVKFSDVLFLAEDEGEAAVDGRDLRMPAQSHNTNHILPRPPLACCEVDISR